MTRTPHALPIGARVCLGFSYLPLSAGVKFPGAAELVVVGHDSNGVTTPCYLVAFPVARVLMVLPERWLVRVGHDLASPGEIYTYGAYTFAGEVLPSCELEARRPRAVDRAIG